MVTIGRGLRGGPCAHVIGGKVEQAYRRGDLLEKRCRLMDAWAAFCTTAPAQEREGNVTPLRRKA